jgi:outer membrane protein OmpA-like peptidoglycan-associated protein
LRKLSAALALLASTALPFGAFASEQEGWQFEISPYLWAFGVDGEVSSGPDEFNFNRDFDEIADNLDKGYSGLFVGSYNRFVFMAQYDTAESDLDGERINRAVGTLQPGANLDGDFEAEIVTGAIGWRFDTFGERSWIDVMLGMREIHLDSDLTISGVAGTPPAATVVRRVGDTEANDTLVMLRPSLQLSERWRFNPTMSFAVDGDSDEHYELSPQFQYQFSDYFAARIGYRSLNYKMEDGPREFDGDISGLMLGLGWTFPRREPPAPPPAPAPAPQPAPAAAPADSDGDGVIDPNDRCPDTPRGDRVGPNGCSCDVSVQLQFAFDSSELTEDDKQTLTDVARRLSELNFVSGVAEGHTDSVGSDAYNQSLSERRAQAVVDFLAGLGIDRSRFTVVGVGEAQPIADNGTDEGRAQNRRVVLRRTDCDTN